MKRQKSIYGTPDLYYLPFAVCVCASVHAYIPHTHTNTHMCMHSRSAYIHVLTYIPTTYIQTQSINAIIDTHIYTHTHLYLPSTVLSHSIMSSSL